MGENTALVMRSSHIYAFNPYGETGISEDPLVRVYGPFRISQSNPNPFNGQTAINYELSVNGEINIGIYDMNGRLVKTLVKEKQRRGDYVGFWDGKNTEGAVVQAGIYFVILKSGIYISGAKLIKM